MKIILLKDVSGTGRKFDVKEVSAGYASNFLFPRKLAVVATEGSVKTLEKEKAKQTALSRVAEDLLLKNLDELHEKRITLTEKANDEGHLFAGIHATEISEAIKKQLKLDIPAEHIDLPKPLKTVGEIEVAAEGYGKKVKFAVVVEGR